MLVGNVAENFVENVFQRHQPLQRAIFVHHQGEMARALAEGVELFFQRGGVGHEPGRRGQRGDVDGVQIAPVLQQRLGEMLGVQHADDVLRLAAPQRHAGVVGVDHRVQQFAPAAGRRPR